MSKQNTGNGIGFLGALFLILLTLKLTHYIDWSWWWIAAPLWIPFAFVVICAIVVVVVLQSFTE